MKLFKIALLFLILAGPIKQLFAQNDTVFVPDVKVLNTHNLKTGLKQYLVYNVLPNSPQTQFMWFWQRNITVKVINHKKVFSIDQKWLAQDSSHYEIFNSINDYENFLPIYHRQKNKNGIVAYNWNDHKITGADSVAGNQKKGFSLNFEKPNLNWNLDMETFEMLPLAKNKVFAINFYDAGLDPPQYIVYKVIGEDYITTYGNSAKIKCWKLFTEGEYKGQKFTETFWISQKTHEVLMEKDDLGNGAFRYKIKMPAFTAAS